MKRALTVDDCMDAISRVMDPIIQSSRWGAATGMDTQLIAIKSRLLRDVRENLLEISRSRPVRKDSAGSQEVTSEPAAAQ